MLFYSGKLLDGVSSEDRAPLLPELPTLMFCNTDKGQVCVPPSNFSPKLYGIQEQHEGYGKYSWFNQYEVRVVIEMIKELFTKGIQASHIGIIALCKWNSQLAR